MDQLAMVSADDSSQQTGLTAQVGWLGLKVGNHFAGLYRSPLREHYLLNVLETCG